jgi:hypothetical protein
MDVLDDGHGPSDDASATRAETRTLLRFQCRRRSSATPLRVETF